MVLEASDDIDEFQNDFDPEQVGQSDFDEGDGELNSDLKSVGDEVQLAARLEHMIMQVKTDNSD